MDQQQQDFTIAFLHDKQYLVESTECEPSQRYNGLMNFIVEQRLKPRKLPLWRRILGI